MKIKINISFTRLKGKIDNVDQVVKYVATFYKKKKKRKIGNVANVCKMSYCEFLNHQLQHRIWCTYSETLVSYLFIGSSASGHKYYVETSEASNRDEEQACNTHYSQPESTWVKEHLMRTEQQIL